MLNAAVVKGGEFIGEKEKLSDVDKSISPEKKETKITPEKQNLNVDFSKIQPNSNIDVLKTIENRTNLPADKIEEMTSLIASKNLSGDVVLTIKVDTSDSDAKAKLERLLQSDTQIRDALVKTLANAQTNDGRKGYLKK